MASESATSKVVTDHMLFKDAAGHACGSDCGEWETLSGPVCNQQP